MCCFRCRHCCWCFLVLMSGFRRCKKRLQSPGRQKRWLKNHKENQIRDAKKRTRPEQGKNQRTTSLSKGSCCCSPWPSLSGLSDLSAIPPRLLQVVDENAIDDERWAFEKCATTKQKMELRRIEIVDQWIMIIGYVYIYIFIYNHSYWGFYLNFCG